MAGAVFQSTSNSTSVNASTREPSKQTTKLRQIHTITDFKLPISTHNLPHFSFSNRILKYIPVPRALVYWQGIDRKVDLWCQISRLNISWVAKLRSRKGWNSENRWLERVLLNFNVIWCQLNLLKLNYRRPFLNRASPSLTNILTSKCSNSKIDSEAATHLIRQLRNFPVRIQLALGSMIYSWTRILKANFHIFHWNFNQIYCRNVWFDRCNDARKRPYIEMEEVELQPRVP